MADQQVTIVQVLSAWFTSGQGTNNLFPNIEGNQISSDEQQEYSDPYIGVAFGST